MMRRARTPSTAGNAAPATPGTPDPAPVTYLEYSMAFLQRFFRILDIRDADDNSIRKVYACAICYWSAFLVPDDAVPLGAAKHELPAANRDGVFSHITFAYNTALSHFEKMHKPMTRTDRQQHRNVWLAIIAEHIDNVQNAVLHTTRMMNEISLSADPEKVGFLNLSALAAVSMVHGESAADGSFELHGVPAVSVTVIAKSRRGESGRVDLEVKAPARTRWWCP